MDASETPYSDQAAGRPALLRGWRLWAIVGGASLLGLFLYSRGGKKDPAAAPGGRPVPVAVATARKGDMAVHLTGLGTVTALNSVTVKSRVDGQLVRVAFTEGQMVREGDLLAEIDPRPFQVQLMQAEGQLAKDQAAWQNAAADLKRLEGLVQQGIISRQQLDTQVSSVAQYAAALKSDQASVESAKLNLTYSRITAPIAGRVGLRLVDVGNMVRATDANGLATIAPVQPINVVFAVPADNIQKVLGQTAKGTKLPVEAWDRDLRTRLGAGALAAIDNQVDPATGTVRLKALFANEDRALFPNQFVNAQLLVDTLQGVVIIPTAAIQRGPQGAFVYVVKPDATVELRVVEIRGADGDESALGKGLSGGETVVTDGLEKLRPGSKVSLPKPTGAKG
jgi:multidrug efflux system membrane fusion protein